MQLQQSIQTKIDIQDNKQALQYYEYVRVITETNEIAYWIGNPSVQIISGKIMFEALSPVKNNKEPQSFQEYLKEIALANSEKKPKEQEEEIQSNSHNLQKIQLQEKSQMKLPIQSLTPHNKCFILCGIPNSKSPVEVMQTDCISRIKHLIKQVRVIKTPHIRYYGMLILVQNYNNSIDMFDELFGCQYNDLEMERILIRKIKSITLNFSQLNVEEGGSNEMNLLRAIKEDLEFIAPENIFMTFHHEKLKLKNKVNSHELVQSNNVSTLVCAICFEECISQTISILCGHYFHFQCLEKWSESICPLCRYHQQPPIIKFCQECNQCQGLWICLICGSRLCCGIHNNILGQDSHIYNHYKVTAHSLSMELQTKFLFDAKIPAFLHQKFYRELMVEGEQQMMKQEKKAQDKSKKNKITFQIQQYESQVSEQMKDQRVYFEEQINQSVRSHRIQLGKKRQIVQGLRAQIQRIDSEQKQSQKQINQLQFLNQKKRKQFEIIKDLINMKEKKVLQKKQKFKLNSKIKLNHLKKLQDQIRQKKQEILNYRKNVQLKQKFSEKLKGEQISGQVFLLEKQEIWLKKLNKRKIDERQNKIAINSINIVYQIALFLIIAVNYLLD